MKISRHLIMSSSLLLSILCSGSKTNQQPTSEPDHYPFTLQPLPYAYVALEPYIDERTMHVHHDQHHQAYVNNLNYALASHPALHTKKLIELLQMLPDLPEPLRTAVRNHGGGHYNHEFFWQSMSAMHDQAIPKELAKTLQVNFGSIEKFKQEFANAANKIFGSGWAWLVQEPSGKLKITTTANQDTPFAQGKPLLCLDVWEHAYYLKHQNKRAAYIQDWWHVVNWQKVDKRLKFHS